jgi:hypothetical protein
MNAASIASPARDVKYRLRPRNRKQWPITVILSTIGFVGMACLIWLSQY